MKMHKRFSVLQGSGVVLLGLVSLLGLTSCGDSEKEPPAPAATTTPQTPSNTKQEALFQNMLYTVGKSFTASAANPEWTETVRDHLVLLQEYYDEMAPSHAGSVERTKLAVRIGEVLNELNAFAKSADAFNKALEDFNAMGDADKSSTEANHLLSSIHTGLGSDLLSQGKATDALPHYEKALEADLKTLSTLMPEGTELPKETLDPAIAASVSDVISSYCCLAYCQRMAEDPEEARETIKKCQGLIKKIEDLPVPPTLSLRYARLLTTLGDLESSCGNSKEALAAWVNAARVCEQVYKQSGSQSARAEAQTRFRQLAAAVRAVQAQIGEEPTEETPADLTDDTAPAEGEAPAAN